MWRVGILITLNWPLCLAARLQMVSAQHPEHCHQREKNIIERVSRQEQIYA